MFITLRIIIIIITIKSYCTQTKFSTYHVDIFPVFCKPYFIIFFFSVNAILYEQKKSETIVNRPN